MNVVKWIGSIIIAILVLGACIGVVALIVSVSTFIFIGVGILSGIALIACGIRSLLR